MNIGYAYKSVPYSHQIKATTFLFNNKGGALFMEQGTGKTKVTIDFAYNLFLQGKIKQLMIIAPNGVHRQWIEEQIPLHCPNKVNSFIWESNTRNKEKLSHFTRNDSSLLKVLSINVEAFSMKTYLSLFNAFLLKDSTLLVLDEATSIKHTSASRTKNILYGLATCKKNGKRLISYKSNATYRVALTGTPEAKGVGALFSIMNFVKEDFWRMNEYAYLLRYTYQKQNVNRITGQRYYAPMTLQERQTVLKIAKKGEDNYQAIIKNYGCSLDDIEQLLQSNNLSMKRFDEFHNKLSTLSFRVTKNDCLDLPEKIYERVVVPMSKEQKEVYNSLLKEAVALYNGKSLEVTNKVALRIRLRQVAGGFFPAVYDEEGIELEDKPTTPIGEPTKASKVVNLLDEMGDKKVIIVTAFRAEAFYLANRLNSLYETTVVVGGLSSKEKQERIDSFTKGNVQILIAVQATIAKGFNMQCADTMIFYSNTENSEDRMQIEDRIHRNGQQHKCLYIDLLTEKSIDYAVEKLLKNDVAFQQAMYKAKNIQEFLSLLTI